MNDTCVLTEVSTIEDPASDKRSFPYLLFALAESDNGELHDRSNQPEYLARQPWCVKWADDHLDLIITNLGEVASDLVQLMYQFRICVNSSHKPDEGFVHEHAGETEGSLMESGSHLDFVPAMQGFNPGIKVVPIKLPDLPPNIANLYFRAKVVTLWNKPSPPATWSFASDRTVVEATKVYPT